MTNLRILALSISTLAACGVSTESDSLTRAEQRQAELARPSADVLDYAVELQACDPAFADKLQSFVDGAAVRPDPAATCTGESEHLESSRVASCFSSAWSRMDWTERAACAAVGFPTCWTIFCSGLI